MATQKISLAQLIKTMRFPQLYRLVQGLQGKKCWKAAFGYGNELHLHFGGAHPLSQPEDGGREQGDLDFRDLWDALASCHVGRLRIFRKS